MNPGTLQAPLCPPAALTPREDKIGGVVFGVVFLVLGLYAVWLFTRRPGHRPGRGRSC